MPAGLRGQQSAENARPPDDGHRTGNGQDITGDEGVLEQASAVGFRRGCFAKEIFYAEKAQVNQNQTSSQPECNFHQGDIQKRNKAEKNECQISRIGTHRAYTGQQGLPESRLQSALDDFQIDRSDRRRQRQAQQYILQQSIFHMR